MGEFIIKGNRALSGNIEISGSKNAALPLIFATVTVRGVSTLHNVPDISDVDVALDIISSFGAKVTRLCGDLIIDTTELFYTRPDDASVSRIRASSYLLGAALSRFGICHLQSFGGCNFDTRPIDMHIGAMTALGAKSEGDAFVADRLYGADIIFDKISVGATVNALILTSSAEGVSRIFGYAKEPHVFSLADFLRSAGARIEVYEEYLEVEGAALGGAEISVIPDMIEAGTYIALSLATDSDIKISGAVPHHLSSFIDVLSGKGVSFSFENGLICASGEPSDFINIVTGPYPDFPTDLQPQMAPLLARFSGGRITERVWKGRFGYLSELKKLGVRYELCDSGAIIRPSQFRPSFVTAPDLRGGIALLIAALSAEGESVIASAEIIKRGYSDIVRKLKGVGADVEEIF